MRRVVLQLMRVTSIFAAALVLTLAGTSWDALAGDVNPPYTPDPEIEQAINQALQSDGAVGERAFKKLVERGAEAEKAIDWNMARAASNQRAKWAELYSRLNRGKVAYRVTLELKADGAGALELWSNRSALAECGRKNDRIHGRPETTYSVDDLKYNPYSRVELLKFFPSGDGVKHLEARVEQPTGDIEARGMLAFKNFESLTAFADQFDAGGYHLLTGARLTDNANVRTYEFRKPAETDRALYEKNLLLFHTARWEFVFDFKGAVNRNNAHRTEGTKLVWTFNCYELLNGLASIQVSFDAAGLAPRTPPAQAGFGDAPQAVVRNPALNVKVFRRAGNTPLPPTKELRERGCLVELDGRESQPSGDGLQYRWRQTSGADLNIPTPDLSRAYLCLIVKEPGEYRFELVVSKNGIYSPPAEVKLFVTEDASTAVAQPEKKQPTAPPQPPVAPVRPPEKKPDPAVAATETKPEIKTPASRPVDLNATETKTVPVDPKKTAVTTPPVEAKKTPVEPPKVENLGKVEKVESVKTAPPEKKVPTGNAKELAAQGASYLKSGSFAEAKRVLMQALEINSADMEAQNNLGLALLELGEYPTAARQFEEVAQVSKSPKAMMNVGHSFARAGNLREAGNWYRRGASVGRDQVEWEPRWQLGNIELRDKNYKEALKLFKEAETMSAKVQAKDRDPRLYKDLATAYFHNNQPKEALQNIKIVQDLGYTADPQLVAEVRKALGTAGGADVKEVVAAKPVETTKPDETKKPDAIVTDATKQTPTPPVDTQKPATEIKTEPKTDPKTVAAVETKPKTDPATVQKTPDQAKTDAVVTAPPTPPKKKAEPKPLPPKRALPPIPTEFDAALAGGKKALETAQKLTAENTEASKLEAYYKYDEAEAMLRAAWSKKPGDEQLVTAFRDLAKHAGAIALVNNTQIRAKAGGLVVLDAEPSIGPKDKALYYAWEQTEGEPLEVRPENLAQKRVGLKIRKPGLYRFDLAVSDGSKGGTPVSVTVEVTE